MNFTKNLIFIIIYSMSQAMGKQSKANSKIDENCHILVLHGKELMLQKLKLDRFKDALTKAHGEIDTYTFDGQTAQLADVLDELRGYSLMGGFKLVIVNDAQTFIKTYRQPLERYAECPVDHAALVLRSENWNKGNLDKKIAKVGAIEKCEQLKPFEAENWLTKRAKRYNTKIDKQSAQLLVQRIGCDMAKLDSELGKLALMADKNLIDKNLITHNIGQSSEEQAWAVQEAILKTIGQPKSGGAIKTVHELVDLAGNSDVLVMYAVCDLMRKLSVGSLMMRAKVSEAQIAKELRIWKQKNLYMNLMHRLEPETVSKLFSECLDLDAKSKTGLGEPIENLEKICIKLSKIKLQNKTINNRRYQY